MSAFWDSYRSAQAAGQAQQNALAEFMQRRSDAEAGNALLGGNYDQAAQVYARRGDVENALKARQYGVQQGALERAKGYGAQFAKGDRTGAVNAAMSAGDFDVADNLRKTIGTLDEQQRAALGRQAEAWARIGTAAKSLPPEQRKAFALQNAGMLTAAGVDPHEIEAHDYSDAGLDRTVALSMTAADWLKHQDAVADNARQDATLAETQRHNGVMESRPQLVPFTDADGRPVLYNARDFMPSSPAAAVNPVTADGVRSSLDQAMPGGYQITSGLRTPAHNAQVGGVPNSAHLDGRALDLVPKGQTMAQLEAGVRQAVPGGKVLNEGDHVHVQWGGAQPVAQGGAPRPVAVGAPKSDAPMSQRQSAQSSMQLRKEFTGEADVKAFNDVATSYQQVRSLALKPNAGPAEDMALTYSFMKMLDPGSVVREGEFAMVGRTAGLPDQIVMALQQVDKGKGLTPDLRRKLVGAAQTVYEARKDRYGALVQQYQGYARDMGLPDGTIQARADVGEPAKKPATGHTDAQWQASQQFKGSKAKSGTSGNPWVPHSPEEFDRLRVGDWFINPADGRVLQKGR
jgi:hypothetical protein